MSTMPIDQIILTCLGFLSGGLITAMFLLSAVRTWRIRCVELEHDLARAEGREPRDIDTLN